jgi:DNA invertase Pin-like site-specific DNA recombinase
LFDYTRNLWNIPGMSAKPAETKPVPVAILVRVSTEKQETARQVNELTAVAEAKGWQVMEVCKETITGRADADDRDGLRRVEALAAAGRVKKVLVHEISRLSRRPSIAHTFVEMLEGHGVSLYWHAQHIETLLASGKRNPAAAIMLAVLAEMARAETDTLRERIMSGLAEARRKGVRLGRPEGKESPAELLERHRDIVRLLTAGQSIRHTAKITGKGGSTVQRVKLAMSAAA